MNEYELYARVASCSDLNDAAQLACEILGPSQILVSDVSLILGDNLIESFKSKLGAIQVTDGKALLEAFQQFKNDAGSVLHRNSASRALIWGQCFYILQHDPQAIESCIALAETHQLLTFATLLRETHKLPDIGDVIVAEPTTKSPPEERLQLLEFYAQAVVSDNSRKFIDDLLNSPQSNTTEVFRTVTAEAGDVMDDDDYKALHERLLDRLEEEFTEELRLRAVAWTRWHILTDENKPEEAAELVKEFRGLADNGCQDFSRDVVGDRSLHHPSHITKNKSFYYVTKLRKETDPETKQTKAVKVRVKEQRLPFDLNEFRAAKNTDLDAYVKRKMLHPQYLFDLCRTGKLKDFNFLAGNRITRKAFEKTFDDVMGRTYVSDKCIFPEAGERAIDEDTLVKWLEPHVIQVHVKLSTVRELVADLNELRDRAGERYEDELMEDKLLLEGVDDDAGSVDSSVEDLDDADVRMEEKKITPENSDDDDTPLMEKAIEKRREQQADDEEDTDDSISDSDVDDELAQEFALKEANKKLKQEEKKKRRAEKTSRRAEKLKKTKNPEPGQTAEEIEAEIAEELADEDEIKRSYSKRKKMALDDDDVKLSKRDLLHELGKVEEEVLEWQFTYKDVVAGLEYISKFTVSRRVLKAISEHLLTLNVVAGVHSGGAELMEVLQAGPTEERKYMLLLITKLQNKYAGKNAKYLDQLFRLASKAVIVTSPLSALHDGHVVEFVKLYHSMPKKAKNLAAEVFSDTALPSVSDEKAWLTMCREFDTERDNTGRTLYQTTGFPFDVIMANDLVAGVHALVRFYWNIVTASKEWTPKLKTVLWDFVKKLWTLKWFTINKETEQTKAADDKTRLAALQQLAVVLQDDIEKYNVATREVDACLTDEKQEIKRDWLRDAMAKIDKHMEQIEKLKNEYAKLNAKIDTGTVQTDQEEHAIEHKSTLDKNLADVLRKNEYVKSRSDFDRTLSAKNELKQRWISADQQLVAATRRKEPISSLRLQCQDAKQEFEKRSAEWDELQRTEPIIRALNDAERFVNGIRLAKQYKDTPSSKRKINHDDVVDKMKALELEIEKHVSELDDKFFYPQEENKISQPRFWLKPMVRKLQLERRVFAPLQEFVCDLVMMSDLNQTKQASVLRNLFKVTQVPCVSLQVAKNIWRYDPVPFACDIQFVNYPTTKAIGEWIATFSEAKQVDRLLQHSAENGFTFLLGPTLLYAALRMGCLTEVFAALINHERMKNARRELLAGQRYKMYYRDYLKRNTYHLFDWLMKMPKNSLSLDGQAGSEADYYLFSAEEIIDHCLHMEFITELEIREMSTRCSSRDAINDMLRAGRNHAEMKFVNDDAPKLRWSYPKLMLYSQFNTDVQQRQIALDYATVKKKHEIQEKKIRVNGRLGPDLATEIARQFPTWEPEPVQSLRNFADSSNKQRVAGFII